VNRAAVSGWQTGEVAWNHTKILTACKKIITVKLYTSNDMIILSICPIAKNALGYVGLKINLLPSDYGFA
jgi:hypothetical protein